MPDPVTPWPDGCQGAVSLTFDDGMQSQLDTAVPVLGENDLTGTFYLNPRAADGSADPESAWRERLQPWLKVARSGHEIGNHTVTHPCSWAFRETRDGGLESMSMEDMALEISEAKRRIELVFPQQKESSFCYPCYHTHIGEGATRQSYVPVVTRYHPAARAKGDYPNFPQTADLYQLFSCPVERFSCQEMIGFIENAMAAGQWAILTFHGIHEGHLAVSDGDFSKLCVHLNRNRERIHVDTVVSVARRIREWRTGENG